MAARKKVVELQAYKDRRRRQREIQDLEQRILLDQISEKQRRRHRAAGNWTLGNRDRLPLAKDRDVRHLQIEYERAREGGKRGNSTTFDPHYRQPYFTEVDQSPRYNPNRDPKVKQLAETHGRQMEYLQNKNRDLERQREEIRRRLEELGRRPPEKDNSTEELLRELREQEARNQRLLNELRLQLADARRPINVVQEPGKKTFIYPVYYGNSLVAEIIAVRQAYLQNGGNDPDLLAQLAQMQAEAQAIDDSLKNAHKRQPRDRKDGNSQLLTLEMENERLQRQLLLLQEQKIISTNRRKDNREDELEREIHRLHRDHLRKMSDLQREMERIRQDTLADRMRLEMQVQQPPPQQPAKIIVQQQPGPAALQRPYVDLDMGPYDQYYSPRRVQAYGHSWDHTPVQTQPEDQYYTLYI